MSFTLRKKKGYFKDCSPVLWETKTGSSMLWRHCQNAILELIATVYNNSEDASFCPFRFTTKTALKSVCNECLAKENHQMGFPKVIH